MPEASQDRCRIVAKMLVFQIHRHSDCPLPPAHGTGTRDNNQASSEVQDAVCRMQYLVGLQSERFHFASLNDTTWTMAQPPELGELFLRTTWIFQAIAAGPIFVWLGLLAVFNMFGKASWT